MWSVCGAGIVMGYPLNKKCRTNYDFTPIWILKSSVLKNLLTDVMIILAVFRENGSDMWIILVVG